MTDERDLTGGLQHRAFGTLEVREDADGKREVAGVGVPYDQEIEFMGIREKFARGAIDTSATDVKLFWRHRDPIGRVVESKNENDGWHHRSVISKTATGDEAYELARDGVIDRFSVGFEPIKHEIEEHDDGSMTITHTKVRLREVSLVPFPAYDNAKLSEVRHQSETEEPQTDNAKEADMGNENNNAADLATRDDLESVKASIAELRERPAGVSAEDFEEVRSNVEDLIRRVEVERESSESNVSSTGARSFGEFVAKIAAGDEQATRAYTGGTSEDAILQDQWVGNLVDIIHKRQVVASTFQRGALPAQGLTVEYAVLDDDTTTVGKQASEGADLGFGKVSIKTDTAAVNTLGGYTTMSRQEIERTQNVSILDTAFTAMAEKYGQAVEALASAALTARIGAASTVTGDLTSQDNVVAALLDLAETFDNNGLSLDGVFLDKATFKALAAVSANDRVLQINQAPADKQGTISVRTISATVAGIPFKVLPGAAANTVAGYDESALRTLEAPGAPVRLQADNVVNLSKDFSVYGYAASFVQRPAGIIKLKKAAA